MEHGGELLAGNAPGSIEIDDCKARNLCVGAQGIIVGKFLDLAILLGAPLGEHLVGCIVVENNFRLRVNSLCCLDSLRFGFTARSQRQSCNSGNKEIFFHNNIVNQN